MDSVPGATDSSAQALLSHQGTTDQGADTAATAGDGSAATAGHQAPKPSWKDVDWSQVDPRELIQNVPSLQGVIGNLSQQHAQKLARQLAQEEQARQAAADQAARTKESREMKRRLAQEDPDRLAQIVSEEVTREEYNEWQADLRRSMQAEFTGYLSSQVQEVYNDPEVQEMMQGADRETLDRLDWRSHDGLASWFRAVNALISEKRAEKRAEDLFKARTKAAGKEAVVEGAREDAGDGVDLGLAGSIPGGRVFTRADLATMDLATYRKYKNIIAVQEREGRLN